MSSVTVSDRFNSSSSDFEQIYREYAPFVYRTAWGVMGTREDAEDILQTVFLKLLRQESSADLRKNPKAYLYRAAVTVSLDVLKSRRRRPVILVEDADRIDATDSYSESAFSEAVHQQLYDAISRLSPESAEVVLLRYMQNMNTAAIAKMLGVSRTVVAVRLFRARARLRRLLLMRGEGR